MQCSIPEILCYIEGYYRRLRHSWEQTRLLAYSVYSVVAENPKDIEDWMPLWFDPSVEEKEVKAIKQGMIAEKDIEYYRSRGIDL